MIFILDPIFSSLNRLHFHVSLAQINIMNEREEGLRLFSTDTSKCLTLLCLWILKTRQQGLEFYPDPERLGKVLEMFLQNGKVIILKI